MDRGYITFQFGGATRRVPVNIGVAADIEEATGVGCIALMRAIGRGEATMLTAAAVIGCALRSIGQDYNDATLKKYAIEAGIIPTNTIAARVLGALLKPPTAGKAAAVAKPAPAAETEAASTTLPN